MSRLLIEKCTSKHDYVACVFSLALWLDKMLHQIDWENFRGSQILMQSRNIQTYTYLYIIFIMQALVKV